MKIAILSRGPKLYSTARLKQAAIERGHSVRVMNPLSFAIQVNEQEPDLFYRNKPLPDLDAVIPRIGASITFFGCALVRQFEQMGVYAQNTSSAISISRDKLRSFQALSRHEIGLPPTAFVRQQSDILHAIERVGGAPIIIKLLEGTQGVGVILAENIKIAEAIIETLHGARQNVLVQKFVAESKGKDVRAFVVGGRVVAAMRRTAQGQEFRSNVHRGGQAEGIELDERYERTAVHAAQIMGLEVAGVDMLEGVDGPQIMEVNSSPGLEGIEGATGIDVAGEVIRHLEDRVLFPEVDLRQRLTLNAGYGVSEFTLTPDSELIGKTVSGSGLRPRDIIILSIKRNGVVIPNPREDRELLLGDELLCFGKLMAMRALVPPDRPRKKKKKKTEKNLTQG
ncbi:MAG: 30S ribosomal protein S6--L-glutamate ligase [Phycisphaerales bacterium]